MMQESLTEKLAAHLMRPVDKETRLRARLHLLDWLGCVAGALKNNFGNPPEGAFGPVASNASWFGNVLEMDDIHRSSILHPGPVIWGTLFARSPVDMKHALDTAVRGYEATIAIGSTFDDRHYAYWHNTTTAGMFGAAVSACLALAPKANLQILTNAMGLAGSVAGGLWQMRHEDTVAKQWHISHAAETGWHAAQAAVNGATGPRYMLEGPQGLYAATCLTPKPMTFPDTWRMWDVSFKPWGACRHAHPAIDAALELKIRLGALNGEISVETYADALTFCDRPNPENVHEAKFSIQHAIAIVATSGEPMLADFEPNAIVALAETRKKIRVVENKTITKRYPEHYGAKVTMNGQSVELINTAGDPERPLSTDNIISKARHLMAWGGLSDAQADNAVKIALEGDDTQAIHAMLSEWLS